MPAKEMDCGFFEPLSMPCEAKTRHEMIRDRARLAARWSLIEMISDA